MIKKKLFILLMLVSLMAFYRVYAADSAKLVKAEDTFKIVTCSDNQHSYVLYLPENYRRVGKPFRVLFCFDPGGDGKAAIQQFLYAGEKYNWILVGSQEAKNGPWNVILEAQDAIFKDVDEKYNVDYISYYAAGFSGGARMSYTFAYKHPERFKGVIACGAGFGLGSQKKNVAVYHCIGQADSNYQEVQDAYNELRRYSVNTKINVFPGGHGWPPKDVINEAIDWLAGLD